MKAMSLTDDNQPIGLTDPPRFQKKVLAVCTEASLDVIGAPTFPRSDTVNSTEHHSPDAVLDSIARPSKAYRCESKRWDTAKPAADLWSL